MTNISFHTRNLIAATLLASACSFASGLSFAASEYDGEGTCAFSRQLADPVERTMFLNRVTFTRQASTSPYGEVDSGTIKEIYHNGERYQIDSYSYDCMSCHDGTVAPAHNISYKSNEQVMAGISGGQLASHPIGMHYGSASYVNKQLKSVDQLNPQVLLADGLVGCLSCHNPLNKSRMHLSIDNDHSNLCFACHNK